MMGLGDEEEEDLDSSVWLPVILDPKMQASKREELLADPAVKEMDLAEITEKEVFVRKASVEDFRKSIENCKPTVHVNFIELYVKFLQKYGHAD